MNEETLKRIYNLAEKQCKNADEFLQLNYDIVEIQEKLDLLEELKRLLRNGKVEKAKEKLK